MFTFDEADYHEVEIKREPIYEREPFLDVYAVRFSHIMLRSKPPHTHALHTYGRTRSRGAFNP